MRRYKTFPTTMPVEVVEPIPLTAAFYQQQKDKLAQLLKTKRELQVRLKDAREMGDLSENGAYKYAKIELGSIGKQLQQVDFLLKHGFVAQPTHSSSIGFGSVVTLGTGKGQVVYTILSEYEANPSHGSISLKSPLGKLLIDKKVGDEVVLEQPGRSMAYTILSVG